MRRVLRIGTRGSTLALTQTRGVQSWLTQQWPGLAVELVSIHTSGDRFVDQPLSAIGGKGLFVKEIEEALSAGTIDCAVHSMKDVPNELAEGLVIAAVPEREDVRDVLIARNGGGLRELAQGARVGTSSLRRMALILAARPDLQVGSLRGNVDTRLRKLDAGDVDAIVLAAAGLRRLGITRSEAKSFDPEEFIPAIGQGALAIECRDDDVVELLAPLDHGETHVAVTAERAFLKQVGGSCRTPLAAYATLNGSSITLRALIASPDGRQVVRGVRTGAVSGAAEIGRALGGKLLSQGGGAILQALEANPQ